MDTDKPTDSPEKQPEVGSIRDIGSFGHMMKAHSYQVWGEYRKAAEHYRKIIAADNMDSNSMAMSENELACCLASEGRVQEAISLSMELLNRRLDAGQKGARFVRCPLKSLALALSLQDPVANAERVDGLHDQMAEQIAADPDSHCEDCLAAERMERALDRDQPRQARIFMRERDVVYERHSRSKSWGEEAMELFHLAKIAFLEDDFGTAREKAQACLEESAKYRPNEPTCEAQRLLAQIARAETEGEKSEALTWAELAYDEAVCLQSPLHQARTLLERGRAWQAAGDAEKARSDWDQAFTIAEKLELRALVRESDQLRRESTESGSL